MKHYRSHKVVQAGKITGISTNEHSCHLTLDDGGAVFVSREYLAKHQPQVGGYFVIYEDSYQSFSPAAAFESGYTAIEQ